MQGRDFLTVPDNTITVNVSVSQDGTVAHKIIHGKVR